MKRLLVLIWWIGLSVSAYAQDFEVSMEQETYSGTINEIIKAPVIVENTSTKTITLIFKKIESQIGTSQKNFYCHHGNCLDEKVEEYLIRLEPGTKLNSLDIALDAGLVPGISLVKYSVFNKNNPSDSKDIELNFLVEEKLEKANLYTSKHIMLKDVYPNPVKDFAFVEYKILQDVDAKIVIHNVLGSSIQELELPKYDDKIKFSASNLNSGIYFYTLYIDETAVMSRKLIVESR